MDDLEFADRLIADVQEDYAAIVPDARSRYMDTWVSLASAIYLRAILKKLDGDFLTAPINSYGEGIGDAIQGQLVRGRAGTSQYDYMTKR